MVFAAVLVLAQATSPVTFQSEATTVRALMPELSKATGLNLVAAKDIEWDVVYLRVKEVSSKDLMDKLAEVTEGTWEKTSDGTIVLKRNMASIAASREEERKEFVKTLTEAFKMAAENKNVTGQERALHAIAQRVGIPTLSTVTKGRRLVFSTHPTSMQRSISLDPASIQSLILEHNKSVDKSDIQGNSEYEEEMKEMEKVLPPELVKMGKDMEAAMKPKRINGSPAKVIVAFSNQYSSVTVNVSLFDAKGDKMGTFDTTLGSRYSRAMREMAEEEQISTTGTRVKGATEDDEQAKKAEPDKTPVLKFSEETSSIIALSSIDDGGVPPAKMTAVRARISKFAEKDPFLAAQTEILSSYAKNAEGNLVLSLGNDFYMFENPRQATVRQLEEEILFMKKEKGWTTSVSSSELAVNRDTLANGIGLLSKSNSFGIEERAFFAWHEDNLGGPYSGIVSAVLSAFGGNPYGWQDKPLLKLYGSMSQGQRNSARSQNGLVVSSMSADQRRLIETICYGASLHVKPYGVSNDIFMEEDFYNFDFKTMIERQMATMKAEKGYLMEPTESMPSGVPSQAVLRISTSDTPAYLPVGAESEDSMFDFYGSMGGMTLDMLASILSMGEMMGQGDFMGELPKEVRPATRHTLKLGLHCTPEVGYIEEHREAVAKGDGKALKITELGDEFNKLLAKKKEDMKRLKPMFELGMGAGRRSGPPPSP